MKAIKNLVRKSGSFGFFVFVFLLLVSIPLYKQGIVCNDELVARFWGMQGPFTFYKHFFQVYLEVGRPLSAPVNSLNMYLGFIGNGAGGFKILQIMTIWLDAGLFTILLNKLFHNKNFSILCGLSIVAFLPVVFEHTAPNAFNALLNLPFALLFVSLILFVDYLSHDRKSMLVASMLLLFVNLTCYEAFLMFIPLYWCIIIGKEGLQDIKQFVYKCLYPSGVAVVFVILYVVFRFLVPTNYEGIQISGFSLKSAVNVVWQLVKSCFPGYYLFIPKYRQQALEYNQLHIENYVRIFFVCGIFVIILFQLLKSAEWNRMKSGAFWGCVGAGVLCIILPTFPLAAAKMYQESVGSGWMAVPVTFFCYFGSTFVCWFCIWRLLERHKANILMILVAAGVSVYLIPIQTMNDIFAQQQDKVFQRLTTIEALFSTDLAKSFAGKDFFTTDLFKHINILAVHDSYWDDFADMKGINIKITNGLGGIGDRRIYFDNNQYAVWAGDAVCILTTECKTGYGVCQYGEDEFILVKYQNPLEDNGLYEYFYVLAEGKLQCTDGKIFFEKLAEQVVGSNYEDCRKVSGYYEDGWLAQRSQLLITSGKKGKIDLGIYCPLEDFEERMISVYVDGNLYNNIPIQGEDQTISIEVEPNRLIRLGLETDFVQENVNGDERELSVVLSFIQGY